MTYGGPCSAERSHVGRVGRRFDMLSLPYVCRQPLGCPAGRTPCDSRIGWTTATRLECRHAPELIVYPGEGHGLTTYENCGAKIEWDIAWFDKYLTKMTEAPKEEAKPDGAT